MRNIFFILLIIFPFILPAQQDDKTNNCNYKFTYGIEVDALPYITGGYYGSFWVGNDNLRFRAIITKIKTPEFVIAEGFENLKTTSYTVIADYFPFSNPGDFSGLWVAGGYEFWTNDVTNKTDKSSGKYNNSVLTIGGGYIINLSKSFYINPWIAGHLSVSGTSDLPIGNRTYSPAVILPEISVKFGVKL